MTRPVEFALLGHQDTWSKILDMVNALRDPCRGALDMETVQSIASWIPARTVARLAVTSYPDAREVRGIYVETFITPDDLRRRALRRSVEKVREGLECALREGARVASLGGFTSIVLEGRPPPGLPAPLAVTTGNALTAAYIVKGVERASRLLGVPLESSRVLIIGSTGDLGSACATYLGPRVRRLLLMARNVRRLMAQEQTLRVRGINAQAAGVRASLRDADVVICVAGLVAPAFDLSDCSPGALICDAGYPKNTRSQGIAPGRHVFWGGLGVVRGTIHSEASRLERFYRFPVSHVAHGCMLEGALLALSGRYQSYSRGRGNITPERIDEVWELAQRHGFALAPFFNEDGPWPVQWEDTA